MCRSVLTVRILAVKHWAVVDVVHNLLVLCQILIQSKLFVAKTTLERLSAQMCQHVLAHVVLEYSGEFALNVIAFIAQFGTDFNALVVFIANLFPYFWKISNSY